MIHWPENTEWQDSNNVPVFDIVGREEDITPSEAFLGKWDKVFYSHYKDKTWDIVLR